MPSAQEKGKGKAVEAEPYVPSPIIIDVLESQLQWVHLWFGSLSNRLIAKFTEEPDMLEEFRKNSSLLVSLGSYFCSILNLISP